MSSAPLIIPRPDPSLSADKARDVRAAAWRFVFDAFEKKKAAIGVTSTSGGDDGTEIMEIPPYETSIPEQ